MYLAPFSASGFFMRICVQSMALITCWCLCFQLVCRCWEINSKKSTFNQARFFLLGKNIQLPFRLVMALDTSWMGLWAADVLTPCRSPATVWKLPVAQNRCASSVLRVGVISWFRSSCPNWIWSLITSMMSITVAHYSRYRHPVDVPLSLQSARLWIKSLGRCTTSG